MKDKTESSIGLELPEGYTICNHNWNIYLDNENLEKCLKCGKTRYRDD